LYQMFSIKWYYYYYYYYSKIWFFFGMRFFKEPKFKANNIFATRFKQKSKLLFCFLDANNELFGTFSVDMFTPTHTDKEWTITNYLCHFRHLSICKPVDWSSTANKTKEVLALWCVYNK
jgi:hypothetical protein